MVMKVPYQQYKKYSLKLQRDPIGSSQLIIAVSFFLLFPKYFVEQYYLILFRLVSVHGSRSNNDI